MAQDPLGKRREREHKTLEAMIGLFCHRHHGQCPKCCPECESLLVYARNRLEKCPYGEQKPPCAQCPIHCYKPSMRAQIRRVMRDTGPAMMWRHPLLAIRHLLDGVMRKSKRVKAE